MPAEKTTVQELPVFMLAPPYRCLEPAGASANLRVATPAEGAVMALHVEDPELEGSIAALAVRALRRARPAHPVVLWSSTPSADLLAVVRLATELGVRAVLAGSTPDPASIRRQLTDPTGVASHVVRWAVDSGRVCGAHAEAELRVILDAAPLCRTLGGLAGEAEVVERTRRSRLQQLGLPSPRAWLNLGHELQTVLFLQRHPELPLHRAATRLGFAEPTPLVHRIRRAFGCRPSQVRSMLGCEPLLSLWFSRATRNANRRRANA
jgi:AraC-like DNA-binding protein